MAINAINDKMKQRMISLEENMIRGQRAFEGRQAFESILLEVNERGICPQFKLEFIRYI